MIQEVRWAVPEGRWGVEKGTQRGDWGAGSLMRIGCEEGAVEGDGWASLEGECARGGVCVHVCFDGDTS